MRSLRWLAIIGVIVGLGAFGWVAVRDDDGDEPAQPAAQSGLPDIVFVMLDDARPEDVARTADLKPDGGFDWVRDHGVQFSTYMTVANLCCPGRATALTGQTTYNHGVQDNTVHKKFDESIASHLQDAGYCTGFTGKVDIHSPDDRPAGWTYWEPLAGEVEDEYNYRLIRREDHEARFRPGDFITDRMAAVTRSQLTDCRKGGRPAMVAMWPIAPHDGSDPEATYAKTDVPTGMTDPSWNENDISDKPEWLQSWFKRARPAEFYAPLQANRVRTLLSVDDALKSYVDLLDEAGRLEDATFILTSDNGFLYGEHRVHDRKDFAYEAAQPALWIAGPGFPVGTTTDAYAANIDLVPTMLAAASADVPTSKYDGRGLQSVVAESDLGHDRFVPFYVPVEEADINRHPPGHGVRTWRFKYTLFDDGTEELYDLASDPDEMRSLHNFEGALEIKKQMRTLQERAQACAGESCRVSAPAVLQGGS